MSGPNFFKFQSMFTLATRCNRHQKTVSVPKCSLGHYVCNGNRTEWSPIRSVIIRVINKITRESDLFNHEYDYRPNWATRSSVTN